MTALQLPCNRDNPNLQLVTYLVQSGGEEPLNKHTKHYGRTAVHCACDHDNPSVQVVMNLVKHKVKELVNKQTKDGYTPLELI